MQARYGIPLALGICAVLSTAILLPEHKRQQAQAKAMAQAFGPHNPYDYRYPTCTSNTHDGWGMWRASDGLWRIQRPDGTIEMLHGSYTRYPALRYLYCQESPR